MRQWTACFAIIISCGMVSDALAQHQSILGNVGPSTRRQEQSEQTNPAVRGLSYFESGQIALARAELKKCLALQPNAPIVLFLKAHIDYYDCKYKDVLSDCSNILNHGEKRPEVYAMRSRAFMRTFDFAKSKADLKTAASLDRDDHWWELQCIEDLEYDHQHAEKDPARRFALACSSPLFEYNTQGFESLAGASPTASRIAAKKEMARESRGVNNRQELIALVKRPDAGHNQTWQELRQELGHSSNKSTEPQLKLVQQYGKQFGNRGILAWDLSRNITLCRWGYLCGYLTKDEAFALMMPHAARIQKNYGSWKQFVLEYFVGRRFWNESKYHEDRARIERTINRLIKDPNGLNKIPWNTPLGVN